MADRIDNYKNMEDFDEKFKMAVNSLLNMDGMTLSENGKVSSEVEIKENRISENDEEAIKESNYLNNLKEGKITEEDIDKLIRDAIETNTKNFF